MYEFIRAVDAAKKAISNLPGVLLKTQYTAVAEELQIHTFHSISCTKALFREKRPGATAAAEPAKARGGNQLMHSHPVQPHHHSKPTKKVTRELR